MNNCLVIIKNKFDFLYFLCRFLVGILVWYRIVEVVDCYRLVVVDCFRSSILG